MSDQLFQLAALAELPGVRAQLIPDEVGAFAGMTSFALLAFREKEFDDVAYLDSPHGATWLEAEYERRPYIEAFAGLTTAALTAEDSITRLVEAAQQLKDTD